MLSQHEIHLAFLELAADLTLKGIMQMGESYETGDLNLRAEGLQNVLAGGKLAMHTYLLAEILCQLSDGGMDK